MPVVNVQAERRGYLEHAKNEQFDVLVIGGGITGLGVAVDAVRCGLERMAKFANRLESVTCVLR